MISGGILPQTPLGELTALPSPLAGFQEFYIEGQERKRRGEEGERGDGMEGKEEREGKEREKGGEGGRREVVTDTAKCQILKNTVGLAVWLGSNAFISINRLSDARRG